MHTPIFPERHGVAPGEDAATQSSGRCVCVVEEEGSEGEESAGEGGLRSGLGLLSGDGALD